MRFNLLHLGLCLLGAASLQAAPDQPNIVVIMADDMGYGDSETYGNDLIKTPNMNRLAKEGVKFTEFYSPAGVCSPSRSAILTGRTPYRNGVWRHLSGNHDAHLRASEITYPKLLKAAGYDTCHVGKWHLLSKQQFNNPEFPQPGEHGYNYWMYTQNNAIKSHKNPNNFFRNGKEVGNTEGYSAQLVAGEAVHWLEDLRDKEKPFVLSVWFHEPHSPIATDSRFQDLYKGQKNSKYMGNITQMDNGIGMVLDALDKEGVSENTIVFFTSDNGPVPAYGGSSGGLRGNKRSGYEGGIRVPGIVRWPAKIKPGTESNVPVIGTDIFATALEVAGVPVPADRTIDAVSILPAFEGKPVDRKIPLFWRTHVSTPQDRVAMRVGDWKIVGNETLTEFQLFNIKEDRNEENDLAKKMPEKTDELKAQIIALWENIEEEGPSEWWKNERQKPSKGGKLSY
ncbi:sulfatase family protein [Rubritalea sp.]|uniref:sulfatase family protein n=1 Tax=Rubritalea sp. TaxID=2109375 RepID=UPI003EF826B9